MSGKGENIVHFAHFARKRIGHILAHNDGIRSKAKRMYILLGNKEGDNFLGVASE